MIRFIKKRVNRNGEEDWTSNDEGFVNTLTVAPSAATPSFGEPIHHSASTPTLPSARVGVARNISNKIQNRVNSSGSSKSHTLEALAEQQRYLDSNVLSRKIDHLSSFDACIEACDALATSSSSAHGNSRDPSTGLTDCSVLVSPEGELLLMPQQKTACTNDDGTIAAASKLSELGEDYESAVYVGNDLGKDMNGFTANGWSLPATNLALRQTQESLQDYSDFVEDIVLSKTEAATRNHVACDKLRAQSFEKGPVYPVDLEKDAELMQMSNFEITRDRVGPMLQNGGTLHRAHVALEEFYSNMAEQETKRWRLASVHHKGALPPLRSEATKAQERSLNRQRTLREMYRRVQLMEDHLADCKRLAKAKWDDVCEAEARVDKLVEERILERGREREKQRLEEFHQAAEQQQQNETPGLNPNSKEIWDLVSSVTESMENGSFEPMSFPQQFGNPAQLGETTASSQTPSLDEASPLRLQENDAVMSKMDTADARMDAEDELGLAEYRHAAFRADRAVQDASGSLLNVLSSLDQVRRSARIAAETNLLSACNAQASCIRSIIQLEREATTERLRHIEQLEQYADAIDVRADLNKYIQEDRRRPGGLAQLGQDDDGGIASALAVLDSHVEGNMGNYSPTEQRCNSANSDDASKKENVAEKLSSEDLEDAIEALFSTSDVLTLNSPETVERQQAQEKFDNAVKLLCEVAEEKSSAARPKRSRMCYALNSKRASHTEIKSQIQFDGLCKLFLAILSGCDCEPGGVSNAKMCMMLSQSFYLSERRSDSDNNDERSNRIYIKDCLIGHPLWAQNDFWDLVLFQCLNESLTNSGVMSNFERLYDASGDSGQRKENRKMKWYDLSLVERMEAASVSQRNHIICLFQT